MFVCLYFFGIISRDTMSVRARTLKWKNEFPNIQNVRHTLARPSWKLRPTPGSPRATAPNWSSVINDLNNAPVAASGPNMPANNAARLWAPLLNEGMSAPMRAPTANEQTYGVRPSRLPAKATLAPFRASRKLPPKSAISFTENGQAPFEFWKHLNRSPVKNGFRNTRSLEASIRREENRRLEDPMAWQNEMTQQMARKTAGFNVPAPGVMAPEYPGEVPPEDVSYALNLSREGFPFQSEHFTPRGWGKWKAQKKGRNWKHPHNTPVPNENGSTTPGGTPNTPGRRTRRRQEHAAATLERFARAEETGVSGNTPGGTIGAPGARGSRFVGTPGFFNGTPAGNNSGTPGTY